MIQAKNSFAEGLVNIISHKAKHLAAVAIPIYKIVPNNTEIASFAQCLKVLSTYQIILVAPDSLEISWYQEYCKKYNITLKVERYADIYFANINGYNKLLLSSLFYERFIDYKYLLIYQLDAFVFEDKLRYWCHKGYDYIGAPWPKNDWPYLSTVYAWLPKYIRWFYKKRIKRMNFVGNGGFSLRKTRKFYLLCILLHKHILRWNSKEAQEDIFWSFFAGIFYPFYKVGHEEIASKFALERGAKHLFEMNNYTLPFGCHAWEKYDKEFWLSVFPKLNY